MKKLILISLVLLNLNVFSQHAHRFDGPVIIKNYKKLEKEDIKGSPYLFEEFNNGKVFFKNKKEPLSYLLNYNAYTNDFEFVQDGNVYQVTNADNIDSIIINNNVIVKTSYTEENNTYNEFLIRLYNDSIKLYKRVDIYYTAPREATSGYDSDKPAEYTRKRPDYFISINEKPAELIKNKKSLLSLFNNDSELNSYIKKEKLNVKKEEDILKAIKYLCRETMN